MALLTNWDIGGDEEWEICNDNGFVYKRRRRHLPSDVGDSLRSPSPPSSSCNRDAESRRRARKKRTLLSLRDKYSKELREQLTSTSLALITESPPPPPSSPPPPAAASTTVVTAPSTEIVELLLLQVEAQESAIEKARELCDYVDAVCDAEEERMGEVLMDLPVWGSPRCLVAALMSSSL